MGIYFFLLYWCILYKCNCEKLNIHQRCKSSKECHSGFCGNYNEESVKRNSYVCLSTNKQLIIGSKCSEGDNCDSGCCLNKKCVEFDACFDEYYGPLISLIIWVIGCLFSFAIGLTWIILIYTFWKYVQDKKVISKFITRHSDIRYLLNEL